MYRIVMSILGMIGRVLAVAALLQLSMAHAQVIHLTLKAGNYVFYCPNRLLWFKSHRERGMAGVLQVLG